MEPTIAAAIVGAVAGIVGGMLVAIANIYAARRSVPFSRLRLQADLEILEKVRQLNLNDRQINKWLQEDIDKRYALPATRKD